jgi:hypothetical protein
MNTAQHHLQPPPVYIPIFVDATRENLGVLKVERCPTRPCVAERLAKIPLASRELTAAWDTNDDGREVHGSPPSGRHVSYIAEPRRGMESLYESVVRHPRFLDLRLHEVHIPASWSDARLRESVRHWTRKCKVDERWIPAWSSFKDKSSLLARPQNQCRPGGVCLLVSFRCDRDTFADVDQRS